MSNIESHKDSDNLHITRKKRRTREKCPNCGITLEHYMNFCSHCGQENHKKRASIRLLFNDFLKDYWTFDSKFFRSINPLITKPGFLTNEFLEGRRKRYIPPIRLYIFVSFIYFFTLSLINGCNNSSKGEKTANTTELPQQQTDSTETTIIDSLNYGYRPNKKPIFSISSENKNGVVSYQYATKSFDDFIIEEIKNNPISKTQYEGMSNDSILKMVKSNEFVYDMYKKQHLLSTDDGGAQFNETFNKRIPVLFFILIPIFAFILFLLFYDKNKYYVDYLVYALHLQSFTFILILINDLLELSINTSIWFDLTFFILFMIYATISAQKVFKKTYTGTFFRVIGSLFLYLMVGLIVFIMALFATIVFL